MRHWLLTAVVALLALSGAASAQSPPRDEMIYPPRPGDKCPPHPDSDTPPLPGTDVPADTPWRYCLEEGHSCPCVPWFQHFCGAGPQPATVPEPGTLALLALGAVGVVVARRPRRG